MSEHEDLLDVLRERRMFLRQTVRELSDEDAARRSTVSQLCLGGLIKHVALTERGWIRFAAGQPDDDRPERTAEFQLLPGETLAQWLDFYQRVAAHTDELVATLDLDTAHPLPPAPWFQPGATWTVRRVVVHIIGETAQHSGHADILRESIDGAKTMG